MQIKKRAKPVKFGKNFSITNEISVNKEENVELEQPIVKSDSEQTTEQIVVEQNPDQSAVEENPLQLPVEGQDPTLPPSSNNDNPIVVETKVKKNILVYFFIVAVIAFVIGIVSMAGISLLVQKRVTKLPVVQTSPSPIPVLTATPTAVEEVNLAEYSIKILNGSGAPGVAAKLKETLGSEGFKIVSTDNANRTNYTDTIISAKKEVKEKYLSKLKEALQKKYVLGDIKTSSVATREADIIITIGSQTNL